MVSFFFFMMVPIYYFIEGSPCQEINKGITFSLDALIEHFLVGFGRITQKKKVNVQTKLNEKNSSLYLD